MNSASYEYRNKSARRGVQFVPMGNVFNCVHEPLYKVLVGKRQCGKISIKALLIIASTGHL